MASPHEMLPDGNLVEPRRCFVTHLECGQSGERYEADRVHGLSASQKPLLVQYDLDALSVHLTPQMVARRPAGLWRYTEWLPVRSVEHRLSLGEAPTPLVPLPRCQLARGMLLAKDEGCLPTHSFKARGMAVAVSMARQLGLSRVALPTNGNAGAALAAYARRAGIEAFVFCPDDTPEILVREIAARGAHVWRVPGLINDCAQVVSEACHAMDWFDMSTLKEPYRIEGKKTMGLELADQMGWTTPDVILYPTGGGTGLIGMWKAFQELKHMGWLSDTLPRMVAVQAHGCAPIVKAYDDGSDSAAPWPHASTVAAGIRVPEAVGDFLILRAIRQSKGFATSVDDDAILAAQREASHRDGMLMCPEGAATYAAYKQELQSGRIADDESVVLFNCASGLKYPLPSVAQKWQAGKRFRWPL